MFAVLLDFIKEKNPQNPFESCTEAEENRCKAQAVEILLARVREDGYLKLENKTRLISYLSPQLRELKNVPAHTVTVNRLVQKLWPLAYLHLENVRSLSFDSQAILLKDLHAQCSIYLLTEFREKIGDDCFERLLRETFFKETVELIPFLKENRKFLLRLAESGENELLFFYLKLLVKVKTDTDGIHLEIHSPRFFLVLIETQCSVLICKLANVLTAPQKEALAHFHSSQGSLLHHAAQKGDVALIKAVKNLYGSEQTILMLALGPNADGNTPLHIACFNPFEDVAEYIWEFYRTDEEKEIALQPNKKNSTPFHLAAEAQATDALLEFYTAKNIYKKHCLVRDEQGYCIAEKAVLHGCEEAVKKLIHSSGSLFQEIRKRQNNGSFSLLHLAVLSKNKGMVRTVWSVLREHNPRIEALLPDKMGRTPLHWAALEGDFAMYMVVYNCVSPFFNKQYFLFQADINNDTPFMLAVQGGNLEIVKHLFNAQLLKSKNYLPPAHDSMLLKKALTGENPEITRYVVECLGNTVEKELYASLKDVIAIEQKLAILPFLDPSEICTFLTHTALTDEQAENAIRPRKNGITPFSFIVAKKNIQAVKLFWLLYRTNEARRKVLDADTLEAFPLSVAASTGDKKLFDFILELYTGKFLIYKLLHPNSKGETLLHRAAQGGNVETIRLVIGLYVEENLLYLFQTSAGTKCSLLHSAVVSGKIEVVRAMVAFCENNGFLGVALQPNIEGYTPLHFAVCQADPQIFDCIWEEFSPAEKQALMENALFSYAVQKGTETIVQKIWNMASPELRQRWLLPNEEGLTPFHLAARNSRLPVVRFVWECYPPEKKKMALQTCKNGKTPLWYAALSQNGPVACFIEQRYSFPLLLGTRALYGIEVFSKELLTNQNTKKGTCIVLKSLHLLWEKKIDDLRELWKNVEEHIATEVLCHDFELAHQLLKYEIITDKAYIQQLVDSGKIANPNQKVVFLSFYPAKAIREIIKKEISKEKKEQWISQKIVLAGELITYKEGICILDKEFAGRILWDSLQTHAESRIALAELENNLKQFPAWVLAILAEDPAAKNAVLHCLRALSFAQLAAVLPVLDAQAFGKAILLWKQPEQKLDILSKATVKQKQSFIDYMEKEWVQHAYNELQKIVHNLLHTAVDQAEKTTADALSLQMKISAHQSILKRLLSIFSEGNFAQYTLGWQNAWQALENQKYALENLLKTIAWNDSIPAKYICPIGGDIMLNPIKLPSSGQICDRSSIERLEPSDGTLRDPFNRAKLFMHQLIEQEELKKEIQAWSAEKRKREDQVGELPAPKKNKPN